MTGLLGRGRQRSGRRPGGRAIRWLLALPAVIGPASCERQPGAPATDVEVVTDTVGDIVVSDPYRWLESGDSGRIAEWVAAQNAWTDIVVGGQVERPAILRRIVELLRLEVVTQPVARNGRYFFMRRSPDDARMAIFMRAGPDSVDRRIIDPFAPGDSFPRTLGILSVTQDGGLVAYTVQRAGSDLSEVRFHDVDRRSDLPVRLPPGRYTGAEVRPDRSGVWFARVEDTGPRLWYRSLSTPVAADSLVFGGDLGPGSLIGAAVSANGRWLGVVVIRGDSVPASDVYIADLEGDGVVRPLVAGIPATFLPTFAGDTMLLQTDWNAPNGRILRVSLEDPRRERWVEIVPEREDAIIEGMTTAGGTVLVNTLKDAHSHLESWAIDGSPLGEVELPVPATISALSGSWEGPEAFFTWTSYPVPATITRYDAVTGEISPWSDPRVPVPDGLRVELHHVTSSDDTRVPVFLVFREGFSPTGTTPAVLTGFGGFNASLSPGYSVESVMTAERGGVFAVAITRGGGEMGDEWHEAGAGARKTSAVDDFLAVARWLIAEGYAGPQRLGALGTAHGGMLVSAAAVREPDLFGAVAATDPLMDLTRIGEGPGADAWVGEYGSPAVPSELAAMLAYSPYQNVDSAAPPPPTLLVAGTSSPIPPFHARKMTARLQALTAGRPYLLREDTLPPGAVTPRFMPVENLADILTFLRMTVGRPPQPGPQS